MMPLIVFGGLMVNVGSIPVWITWLQWLSPIRYGIEIFLRNELEDITFPANMSPLDQFDFNVGMQNCIVYLVILTVVTRILSLVFLKLLVSKF
jgi:hypothetical protein